MTKSLWKAVRKGPIYCAPRCGMNCTWKAYQETKAFGKQMATSLGQGWTARVWENLGWHVVAISPCKRVRVGPDRDNNRDGKLRGYHAYICNADDQGIRYSGHAKTARRAIDQAKAKAKEDLRKIGAILKELAEV